MNKLDKATLEKLASKTMETSFGIKNAEVTVKRIGFSWFEFSFNGYDLQLNLGGVVANNPMPYITAIGPEATKALMRNYR